MTQFNIKNSSVGQMNESGDNIQVQATGADSHVSSVTNKTQRVTKSPSSRAPSERAKFFVVGAFLLVVAVGFGIWVSPWRHCLIIGDKYSFGFFHLRPVLAVAHLQVQCQLRGKDWYLDW